MLLKLKPSAGSSWGNCRWKGKVNLMKRSLFLLSLPLVTTSLLAAQPETNLAAHDVMAAEKARIGALERSDIATLSQIMADDVTYVHASGKVDSKSSYLEAIRSGKLHYISWTAKNLRVRMIGTGAAIDGEYAVRVKDSRVQPEPFDITIFILTVYERRNGRWQQIAWQSTRDVAV